MADPMPQPDTEQGILARMLGEVDRRLRELEAPSGTQRNLVLRDLTETVEMLRAVADVRYAEFTDQKQLSQGSWAAGMPAVQVTSPTGRIEITFGGSVNNGDGYFCYTITGQNAGVIVTRDSVRENPARRVGVSGGATFQPTGYKTVILQVPIGEPVTVRLEVLAVNAYPNLYVFGGSVSARVAP
ncbi:hypothetical protein Leucomu_13545 [Leucobacter muris]|uniref:Uncharacterized protein n=1 Tax=Leucobacter muris TaxID=1935379 RepID=A0ABX5QI76_9MICO|nr:hypothetical protein [Leucobacter muris]QAB18797.1 hypothetical protein Leucomu_13545 [Leucobacter muris]